ncbi:MAG: hypothetical protein ACK5AZ_03705 [Bryobacteraceae bacterium]
MFAVRTVFPDQARVEESTFELTPTHEQGEKVCSLFRDWLSMQPTEFRAPVPFLKRGDIEMQWAAASGGVAFASFFESGSALSMSVLLSGVDEEADLGMLAGLVSSVIEPILGIEARRILEVRERPLLATIILPGSPELAPTLQLLTTALASVFFRTILALRDEAREG